MKPQTKEEGDLETLQSWMEVGDLLARPKEEARRLPVRSEFLFPSLEFLFGLLLPAIFLPLHFSSSFRG